MRITKQVLKSYYRNYLSEFNIFLLLGITMLPLLIIVIIFALWLDIQERFRLYD